MQQSVLYNFVALSSPVLTWLLLLIEKIGPVLVAIAAILAALKAFRWADEYTKAKDEVIRSKDAVIDLLHERINTLNSIAPKFLLDHVKASQELFEMRITEIQREKDDAEARLVELRTHYQTQEQEAAHLKENVQRLSQDQASPSHAAPELERLQLEINKKDEGLIRQAAEISEVAQQVAMLEEQLQKTREFDESTETLARYLDHFDDLFTRYYEAVRQEDLEQMEAIYQRFSGSLAFIESLRQHVALHERQIAVFEPYFRGLLIEYRTALDEGAPMSSMAGLSGRRFSLERGLLWHLSESRRKRLLETES